MSRGREQQRSEKRNRTVFKLKLVVGVIIGCLGVHITTSNTNRGFIGVGSKVLPGGKK